MDPQLAHLRDLVGLLMAVMLIVALLVYLIPAGECDRCAHCRQERVKRHAEARPWLQRREADDPTCPLHKIPRSKCAESHDGD